MIDLIGDHLDLFRKNQAAIGVGVMGTLSSEERDDKLKHHLMASKELHPALISPESDYKAVAASEAAAKSLADMSLAEDSESSKEEEEAEESATEKGSEDETDKLRKTALDKLEKACEDSVFDRTGKAFTSKGMRVLELVGKETMDLLISETGIEVDRCSKDGGEKANEDQLYEEVTFDRCFYIYGVQNNWRFTSALAGQAIN